MGGGRGLLPTPCCLSPCSLDIASLGLEQERPFQRQALTQSSVSGAAPSSTSPQCCCFLIINAGPNYIPGEFCIQNPASAQYNKIIVALRGSAHSSGFLHSCILLGQHKTLFLGLLFFKRFAIQTANAHWGIK